MAWTEPTSRGSVRRKFAYGHARLCILKHDSHNTVRTHLRHLYAKFGTHRRTDTIARARALGLLAPYPRMY